MTSGEATILPFGGKMPRVHETAFIAPGARIIVHVEGPRPDFEGLPTIVGEDVLIGHMAILHGCIVEDRA